jgi:hypothetical protein
MKQFIIGFTTGMLLFTISGFSQTEKPLPPPPSEAAPPPPLPPAMKMMKTKHPKQLHRFNSDQLPPEPKLPGAPPPAPPSPKKLT